MEITGDPLPYGIAPNRRVIDELIRHALTQGIITKAGDGGRIVRAQHAQAWWGDPPPFIPGAECGVCRVR